MNKITRELGADEVKKKSDKNILFLEITRVGKDMSGKITYALIRKLERVKL